MVGLRTYQHLCTSLLYSCFFIQHCTFISSSIYAHDRCCLQTHTRLYTEGSSHWNAPWSTALYCMHSSYMLLVRTKQALWIASKEISGEVNGRQLASTGSGMKYLPSQTLNIYILHFHIHKYCGLLPSIFAKTEA
jgi:hypothetical protein